MVGDTKIKVYFLKRGNKKPNSASYNRFLMMIDMVSQHFDYEIYEVDWNKQNKIFNNRYIEAIVTSFFVIWLAMKVPSISKQKSIIFLFSTNLFISFFVFIITRFKNLKLIIERNEFPEIIRNNISWKVFIYRKFILWWQYRLYDGMFLMTDKLIDFYTPHIKKNCLIVKLPMTVDINRFKGIKNKKNEEEYIFYAGSLNQKKDGIDYLIKAFFSIHKKFPHLKLKIAGGSKNCIEENRLKDLVIKLKLNDVIEILGILERKIIPSCIINAKILVLPRPDSIQARGGFPTKLGEYLVAEVPVITTRVGEVDTLLSDRDVYFISPYNIEKELIKVITEILDNYEKAKIKAKHGKRTAYNTFSTKVNAIVVEKMIVNLFNS